MWKVFKLYINIFESNILVRKLIILTIRIGIKNNGNKIQLIKKIR